MGTEVGLCHASVSAVVPAVSIAANNCHSAQHCPVLSATAVVITAGQCLSFALQLAWIVLGACHHIFTPLGVALAMTRITLATCHAYCVTRHLMQWRWCAHH